MPHYENPNIHFKIPVYGMSGYLENMYDNEGKGYAPVFVLTDSQEPEELCLFIQTPDCYREAMMYATMAYYRRVNIFSNKIDIRTVSTIFNLVRDLTDRNIDTYVFYPEKFHKDEIPDDYVRNRFKKMMVWQSKVYPDISVEYRISNPTDEEAYKKGEIPKDLLYYDIVIKLPKEVIYLPALVTYDKMNKWCKKNRKILIPYLTRYYDNTVTYADLECNPDWHSKYAPYTFVKSFPTHTTYITAKTSDPNLNLMGVYPSLKVRRFV